MLTRAEMEREIKAGGSVLVKTSTSTGLRKKRVVSRVEDLPDAATLAGNDPAAQAATREDLLKQQGALADQLAKLDKAKAKTDADAKAKADADAKAKADAAKK